MRTLRRPISLAAAVAAAALALSGCSDTNFGAQTSQPYQAGIGANLRGDIDVLNALLVANPDGTATVSAGVVNQTDTKDAITGVTATTLDGTTLTVEAPATEMALPPAKIVPLGESGGAGVYVVEDAPIGKYVRLTVTFSSAATATIEAPVVTRGESYEEVATG
ncbi:MAG: hypothetical protein WB508_08660 [Aeromicrobium sp.]|uniref:hypothetical protein n=1 Tax=Aeromicrobium sp. TaxID=1871063 RepID=UPI003C5DB177